MTNIQKGDIVWVLSEYVWEKAVVVITPRANSKTVLVARTNFPNGYQYRVSLDKVALPNEMICIVWEKWRGKNGRGGYRLDKTMYPQYHVIAANGAGPTFDYSGKRGRVCESAFGVLDL